MSKGIGNATVISYKLKWEIENFSKIYMKDFGLMSPAFRTNDRIDCDIKSFLRNPNSDVDNKKQLWLMFFGLDDKEDEVNAKIFNNNGEVVVDQILKDISKNPPVAKMCEEFVLQDFVLNPANEVLNGDKLTIVFEITENTNKVKRQKAEKQEVEKRENDILKAISDLYNDDKYSDVSLVAEGKTIKAHKCILAKRNSVFAAMFDTDMKEKQKNTVEIEDMKYDVLVELIRFIYTEKVNNIVEIVDELAIAADQYAVDDLKKMCEKTMRENLSLENFVGCLQLADRLHMVRLKQEVIEFIFKNAKVISDKPEFDSVPDDIVRQVFRCLVKKLDCKCCSYVICSCLNNYL